VDLLACPVRSCVSRSLTVVNRRPVIYLLAQTTTKDTYIKLADFGFAKKIPSYNGCRTLCGTPGYLAPEILERWPAYDTKCDLWSVGVILFVLLGGYLHFEDEDENKVFDRTRNGQYEFYPDFWGRVSGDAKELVTKLLTINPSKRFSARMALDHKYMTTDDQALRNESVDVEKMKKSLASGKQKIKAAIKALVVANRLQDLSDGFNKYLENKRGDEPTFKSRPSMNPNVKADTLDSESGKPFEDFYDLGDLVSFVIQSVGNFE